MLQGIILILLCDLIVIVPNFTSGANETFKGSPSFPTTILSPKSSLDGSSEISRPVVKGLKFLNFTEALEVVQKISSPEMFKASDVLATFAAVDNFSRALLHVRSVMSIMKPSFAKWICPGTSIFRSQSHRSNPASPSHGPPAAAPPRSAANQSSGSRTIAPPEALPPVGCT
jgi:hypothetical protein